MNNKDLAKIMLPMIRKVAPSLIAQDIVGVQPMQAPVGQVFTMNASFNKIITYEVLTEGWEKVCPAGHSAIMVNVEIANWIEHQPVHMWKYIDLSKDGKTFITATHFFVSNELLTWLKLRWE
jgi:hypothetical protein